MEPGNRVHSVFDLKDRPVDLTENSKYVVAVKYFIALGRDGYDCLTDASVEWISDLDSAQTIQNIVVQSFERFGPNYQILESREAIR